MAWPEFAVPLTIHDLPPRETYIQIAASLKALQEAVNGVFAGIEGAVESKRGNNVMLVLIRAYRAVTFHHSISLTMSQYHSTLVQSAWRSLQRRSRA